MLTAWSSSSSGFFVFAFLLGFDVPSAFGMKLVREKSETKEEIYVPSFYAF